MTGQQQLVLHAAHPNERKQLNERRPIFTKASVVREYVVRMIRGPNAPPRIACTSNNVTRSRDAVCRISDDEHYSIFSIYVYWSAEILTP